MESYLPYLISAVLAACAALSVLRKTKPVLDPKQYQDFKLIEKIQLSSNTAQYRFSLKNADDVLGLPIGQHISVRAEINGKIISRSYTPTSSDEDLGFFDLVIKSYPTGNISKLFGELKLGDSISVSGPKGNFNYSANMAKVICMVAGGTGITPMLQIIRAICRNPADNTQIKLIFANVTEEDILLRQELEELAAKHSNFDVHYVLNNPPQNWAGSVGFVTLDILKAHLPKPSADVRVLICGPPPMVSAISKSTTELGFEKPRAISKLGDQVFKF